jgi:hypothetical protein
MSKVLSPATGAARANRKKPASIKTGKVPNMVLGRDIDISKITWSVSCAEEGTCQLPIVLTRWPQKPTSGAVSMSYANYDGNTFRIVLDNVRMVTSLNAFEKPEGGSKHTFSVGLDDKSSDSPGMLAFMASLTPPNTDNDARLGALLTHLGDEGIKLPLWGTDTTALTIAYDPKKTVVLDGKADDLVAGAVVKLALSPAIWYVGGDDGEAGKAGLKLRADSIKILEKKDATEIDWNACM